ncbi:MAG: MBL fold metallo-hydrolase [Proteobacteria bacterium]|nr:MBL fold metallo-hydrolase [Pseudomonadota bacterium]
MSVLTYSASKEGFKSNSHLILLENQAILIDAQFNTDDANKVVDLVSNTGKLLSTIIITHPHPDHYYGLEVIGKKFPQAEIYGGKETIKQITNTSKYWSINNELSWDPGRFKVLDGGKLIFEEVELEFKIYSNSESIENTVVYSPSQKTLFIGDLASNNVHMWLTEGNSENWIKILDEIQEIGPIVKVYPGHGTASDQSIIEQAKKYITDLNSVVGSSGNTKEAILKIKEMYPNYEMPEILEGSVIGLFEKNNLN